MYNFQQYKCLKYINKRRWMSYWYQIDEVLKLSPKNVLEIGKGAGIFKANMINLGTEVVTLDIEEDLNPDFVGSVTEMPFTDNSFDVVVAFQVLEHLPYEEFKIALNELVRVSRSYVLVSLPDASKKFRYSFHIPKYGEVNIYISLPNWLPKKHKFNGEHYWEIGKKNYPIEKIKKDIVDCNLIIIKDFRVPEHTYHRFFVLKKDMKK